jgi:hypothetical protein
LPSLAAFYTLSCGLLLEHSTSQLVWFGLANEMEGFGHLTRCTNEVPPQALFYFLFLFSFSSSPLPLVAGDDSSSASCWEKFSPHGEGRGDLNHRPCQGVRTHLLGTVMLVSLEKVRQAAWAQHHHTSGWPGMACWVTTGPPHHTTDH